jgi:hypothetical protein
VKLSVAAREEVRRQLRAHPNLKHHLSSRTEVSRLPKDELIALSGKLGVDVRAIAENAFQAGGVTGILEPVVVQIMGYNEQPPAFSGILEFEIAIEMLGKKVSRKARAIYTYIPEWEYFDLARGGVFQGSPGSTIQLEVLAMPEGYTFKSGPDGKHVREKLSPTWTGFDVAETGVLSQEVWDAVEGAIDDKCRAEDGIKRREHQLR